jgi:penicillin-binding protein 2
MSLHPNELARRGRTASWALLGLFLVLLGVFFRTQIIQHSRYTSQSEENRLREVPMPAPRGMIFDRNHKILAENVPGYSVQLLSASADSLRATLTRLAALVPLTPDQIDLAMRRYARAPARPTVVFADAPFKVVSVLEERRLEFPGLEIQSAPKR